MEAQTTLIQIDARETQVCNRALGGAGMLRLPIGSARPGARSFRNQIPTPLELEEAINGVEDAVMPLARTLPRGSVLVTCDGLARELAALLRLPAPGDAELTLQDVEHVFSQLAAVAQGRPLASSGLPADPAFAGYLVILREFMHHLGFERVTVLREDA
ncbi:MAG: hypothetical protein V4614_18355 [Pseudomonadota bacterium]